MTMADEIKKGEASVENAEEASGELSEEKLDDASGGLFFSRRRWKSPTLANDEEGEEDLGDSIVFRRTT